MKELIKKIAIKIAKEYDKNYSPEFENRDSKNWGETEDVEQKKIAAKEKTYQYDPKHKNPPHGFGWTKTEKGWTKNLDINSVKKEQKKLLEQTSIPQEKIVKEDYTKNNL